MAIQGRGPEWKSNGRSGVSKGDQDFLSTRNLVHGSHEGTMPTYGQPKPTTH